MICLRVRCCSYLVSFVGGVGLLLELFVLVWLDSTLCANSVVICVLHVCVFVDIIW